MGDKNGDKVADKVPTFQVKQHTFGETVGDIVRDHLGDNWETSRRHGT